MKINKSKGQIENMEVKNSFIPRAILLFVVGVLFSLVINLLQIQHHLPSVKSELTSKFLLSPLWIPVVCGTGAAFVGLMYPCLDTKLGEYQIESQQWSEVMRCVTLFIGINQAITKINFTSNFELSLSLAVLSMALWWVFDRTRSGFGMGVSIAIIATFVTQMLIQHEIYKFSEREFLYIRSWLPCVVFSGGVTVGNIGRQLALIAEDSSTKKHQE